MIFHLLVLTMAVIMAVITFLGILTAPSELGTLTQFALWGSMGMWFATIRNGIATIGGHKRITRVESLIAKSKDLMDTARIYSEMGMTIEALEAANEAQRISDKASRLLEGKEEKCQEEKPKDT